MLAVSLYENTTLSNNHPGCLFNKPAGEGTQTQPLHTRRHWKYSWKIVITFNCKIASSARTTRVEYFANRTCKDPIELTSSHCKQFIHSHSPSTQLNSVFICIYRTLTGRCSPSMTICQKIQWTLVKRTWHRSNIQWCPFMCQQQNTKLNADI